MLLETANGIMRRLQTAVNDAWPPDNKPTSFQNVQRNGYSMQFDRGYLTMERRADNTLMLEVRVPNSVGTRYQAHSSYFENSGYVHATHLWSTIHLADQEAELISHTVALMSLVIAPDREP